MRTGLEIARNNTIEADAKKMMRFFIIVVG